LVGIASKISRETEASGRVGGAGMICSAITGAAAGTAIMLGLVRQHN
jgi:hypothetical protein